MDKYRQNVLSFKETVKGKEFFVFDTETTGLSAVENDIIQFSAVKVKEDGGIFKEVDYLDFYINPGYPIPEKITEITGISDETVKDGKTFDEAAKAIAAFFGNNPIVCGYNSVTFDEKFLNALYQKALKKSFSPALHLDVLKMARDKKEEKPHKLINLAEFAGVADKYTFHSSIDDARATLDVLNFILPMYDKKEEVKDTSAFSITAVRRWKKSATLDRIYVSNNLGVSVYYDVAMEEWMIAGNYDEEKIVGAVLSYCEVSSAAELVEKVR